MTSQLLLMGKKQPSNCNAAESQQASTAKSLQNPYRILQDQNQDNPPQKFNSPLKGMAQFPFMFYYTHL